MYILFYYCQLMHIYVYTHRNWIILVSLSSILIYLQLYVTQRNALLYIRINYCDCNLPFCSIFQYSNAINICKIFYVHNIFIISNL